MSNILKSFKPERFANNRASSPEVARMAAVRHNAIGVAIGDVVVAFGGAAGFDSPEVRAAVTGANAYGQVPQPETAVNDVEQARPLATIEESSTAGGTAMGHAAAALEANGVSTMPFQPAQPVVAERVIPDQPNPQPLDLQGIRDELPGIYATGAGN